MFDWLRRVFNALGVPRRKKGNEVPNTPEWEAFLRKLRLGATEFAVLAGINPSQFWPVSKGSPAPAEMQLKIDAFLKNNTCDCCKQYWERANERPTSEATKAKKPPGD